jgi:Cu2+-exporting ATPase
MTYPLDADVFPAAETACFHCGEPLPAARIERARIGGIERPMCCAGCKAVAEAIDAAGLDAYYARRSSRAQRASRSGDLELELLQVLDSPAYQRAVVRTCPDATREVSLLLEGVTCAACIWLIERRLQALAGVVEASVNYSTQRAVVRWDAERTALSDIVAAIRAIGYDAQPYDGRRADERRRRANRTSLWRLFVAGFGMMQVMMYAVPAYVARGDMDADVASLMRWASLALTVPVVGFSAVPFFRGAWRDLSARTVGMDVPVALAIVVAFAASVQATLTRSGDVYFDSIAMFVFLLLGARHLEAMLRTRAGEAIDRIGGLLPAFATRLESTAAGAVPRRVAVADLAPGDRVVIAAGESVPADGVVESGESEVDESLLTGESRGVGKCAGAPLTGGSVNMSSRIVMRVERIGAETVLAAIGRLLERAAADKPRIAQLADRIAARFVVAVLVVAALAGMAWWFVDPARALAIAVTVLVITCPCALSLATPAALAAATGSLTRLGVLVARGHALTALAHATDFVFDKTGTLTTGEPAVVGVMPLAALDAGDCLALAGALEADSRHPLGRALASAAGRCTGAAPRELDAARDVSGEGVEAIYGGRRIRIGRPDFVAALAAAPRPLELAYCADGMQIVALGDEREWIALFTLADTLRPQARALVRTLRDAGRRVWLLTGDREAVARAVAREAGIESLRAEARPEDKVAFVRELQARGAIVVMVGDGVNDAPVLAQAQVSIALGTGADIAQGNADVVLAQCGLGRLQEVYAVACNAHRIVVQNLAWAGVYNAVAVPAAVLGFVDPLVAAVGMAASSLIVVANAMRAAHPALWRRPVAVRSAAIRTPSGVRRRLLGSV